ncbi:MAG: hypothetical protein ABJB66_07195 [Gemmatimonadaceae bacterium]
MASPLVAQTATPIPLRKLTIVSQSPEHLGSAPKNVRGLPSGRALVHDPLHKRVIVVDSRLKTVAVSADSVNGTYPQAFPGTQLIPSLAL